MNLNNKYSFLFPGQGSQFKGMGLSQINKLDFALEYYRIAKGVLGYDIRDILNTEDLNKTFYTQPAIFIDSIIKDHLLKINKIQPTAVSGHSLGEYSALVSNEVIKFKDALQIIKIRSEEMEKAGNNNTGGMLAIIGANHEQIKKICLNGDVLVPANYNSKEQTVLSGDKSSIIKAIAFCKENNIGKAIPLKTSAAFHSPLMKSARNSLTKVIKSVEFKNAKVPIYQNTNPSPETDANTIKLNLLKQLESPVYWLDIILSMKKNNSLNFIEVGPGNVLRNLNKRISKNIFTEKIDFEKLI